MSTPLLNLARRYQQRRDCGIWPRGSTCFSLFFIYLGQIVAWRARELQCYQGPFLELYADSALLVVDFMLATIPDSNGPSPAVGNHMPEVPYSAVGSHMPGSPSKEELKREMMQMKE